MKLFQLFIYVSLVSACTQQPMKQSSIEEPITIIASSSSSSDITDVQNKEIQAEVEKTIENAPLKLVDVASESDDSESSNTTEIVNFVDTHEKDLWQRIINLYAFDQNIDNKRVQAHLNWFKKHPLYMDTIAKRAKRYLHYITEQVDIRNIPGEIALLPIVESAFDPFAYSHGRAAGVWQFIPSTGKAYGLEQDWWHDGRRDISTSTLAALSYLESLHRRFDGDWLLALAAYNAGGGNVNKAIRKNRNAGKPTDFWSLKLPKETQNYVPRLIALSRIIKESEEHGITLAPLPNAPYFASVNTGGQIDLSQLAEISDTSLEEIYKLNPSYNRWATRPNGPHNVLVPIEKEEIFLKNIATLPSNKRMKWERYKIRSGDSLSSIAQKFQTTPKVIKDTNNLSSNTIRIGKQLLIPSSHKSLKNYSYSANSRLTKIQNSPRRSSNQNKVEYTVKNGDSFWKIARNHKVSVKELSKWNGMAPGDTLRKGQNLVIWAPKKNSQTRQVIRKLTYTVRNGDSFAGISDKFQVKMADLMSWNKKKSKRKYLQPGQKLTLYVDVTK